MENYYNVSVKLDVEKSNLRTKIVEEKFKIPEMPDIAINLDKELKQRYINVNKIIEIISYNNVVMGEILGTLDGLGYRKQLPSGVKILSIQQAIKYFGVAKISQLAISSALRNIPCPNELFRSIINHSSDVAHAASEVSAFVQDVDPSLAHVYCLFMHSGMTLLATRYPDVYKEIFDFSLTSPQRAYEKETSIYKGFRHELLSVDVARKWSFDIGHPNKEIDEMNKLVLLAIQEQHNELYDHFEDEKLRLLIAVGNLSSAIINELVYGVYMTEDANIEYKKAREVLMLSDDQMMMIRKNVGAYFVGN
jgi:HD-like signal output (HDOD) protein